MQFVVLKAVIQEDQPAVASSAADKRRSEYISKDEALKEK